MVIFVCMFYWTLSIIIGPTYHNLVMSLLMFRWIMNIRKDLNSYSACYCQCMITRNATHSDFDDKAVSTYYNVTTLLCHCPICHLYKCKVIPCRFLQYTYNNYLKAKRLFSIRHKKQSVVICISKWNDMYTNTKYLRDTTLYANSCMLEFSFPEMQ